MRQAQCTNAVLMIRPAAFDYNPETAVTNAMQKEAGRENAAALAKDEFDHVVRALESEGIAVCVVEDVPEPPKPDAVFPNNWISFHADGTVVLYPMQSASRRRERRLDVIDAAKDKLGFKLTRLVDLTSHEDEGCFLEGTGSLVLDHVNRVAYAALSPRTHASVLQQWCVEMGYEAVTFEALDQNGKPIYHTNVLMCIGERLAILGGEAMKPSDRDHVRERLLASGREVIEISHSQIAQFAGNVLELASWDEALGDCRVLVMSTTARAAFNDADFARLSACTDTVLTVPVPTIERLGGGGVRCMLAEVFLPE
jgi:hypothetical protein